MNDRARVPRRVGAILAVGIAGILLAEGAVRLRQWVRVGRMRTFDDIVAVDPATGLHVPRPNRMSGGVHINSLGFRGPELAVPKPPGDVRLAFLGGSTTYCAEVSSNETAWPHLVWQS